MAQPDPVKVTQQTDQPPASNQATAPAVSLPGGWGALDAFRREMDRLLDDFGAPGWPSRGAMRLMANIPPVPAMDLVETETGYEVSAELPGMNPEDVELKVSGDILILKGEKREEKETKDKDRHVSERRYGSFQRSLRLPPDADAAAISARTAHGVLTVTIPKSAAASAKEKKIDIAKG